MKKLDFGEVLGFIMVFGFAMFTFMRGLFWFVSQDSVINDSQFYTKLHEVMPIWLWGILLMIIAVKLFVAAFFIPSEKYSNVCNWLFVAGGIGAAVMYFLMTSASIFNAINWLTWAQFAVLTAKSAAMAFIGGVGLRESRR